MVSDPEAMIVLGGGISTEGVLSDISLSRVGQALELYRNQRVPMVMSGRWSLLADSEPARTEATALREYVIQNGVPESDVVIEEESMETVGNAYFSYLRHIKPRQWHEVKVITSAFHRERALYSFRKVLGSLCTVQVACPPDIFSPNEQMATLGREKVITQLVRDLFDPITDGDLDAIWAKLQEFPDYSLVPKYSKQFLLNLINQSDRIGDTYA